MLYSPLPPAIVSCTDSEPWQTPIRYWPYPFDEVVFQSGCAPASPPRYSPAVNFDCEETQFSSSITTLTEVDIAVHVNVSRWVSHCSGVQIRRKKDGLDQCCVHEFTNESSTFAIICVSPEIGLGAELHRIDSQMIGANTLSIVQYAWDNGILQFAATDYAHWLFYSINESDGNLVLNVKALLHSNVGPTVREWVAQSVKPFTSEHIHKLLVERRYAARSLELTVKTRAYVTLSFASRPTSRLNFDREMMSLLDKLKQSGSVLDLLYDDVLVHKVAELGTHTHLVRIHGRKMVLKVFDQYSEWDSQVSLISGCLSGLQGSTIPFLYSTVITDPYHMQGKRQLGILYEYVTGIPLKQWSQSVLDQPKEDLQRHTAIVRCNAYAAVHKLHMQNVAHCRLARGILINPSDLSARIVSLDKAVVGEGFFQDSTYLASAIGHYNPANVENLR